MLGKLNTRDDMTIICLTYYSESTTQFLDSTGIWYNNALKNEMVITGISNTDTWHQFELIYCTCSVSKLQSIIEK